MFIHTSSLSSQSLPCVRAGSRGVGASLPILHSHIPLPSPGPLFVSCLVVEVKVPAYEVGGSDARLLCDYSLEGATLYSLKWYKGDSQFYQFIPANQQPKTTFRVDGVDVDVSWGGRSRRRCELGGSSKR